MPYCGNCGKKFSDHLNFCPHCGEPNDLLSETIDNNTAESKPFPEQASGEFVTQIRGDQQVYGRLNLEYLLAGHVIHKRYEIKEKLGQGGFGAVYLVYDKVMGIDKALKIIPEVVSSDKEAMFDLQKEARTMIALNHANIVRVYDFHNLGTIKYIYMEYVDGKTLREIKLEYPDKCVPEERVKELAIKIAKGMAYAHDNNVLHKDIKPQNIKVNSKGEIKIMDFGIAETVRTSMSRLQNSSSSGTLVYMSPEQINGENVGKESDIYSFGAMLYELLSGHPPFYTGDINFQILTKPAKRLEHISSDLADIIAKCLEKDYKLRFKEFLKVKDSLSGNNVVSKKPQKITPVVPVIQKQEMKEKKANKEKDKINILTFINYIKLLGLQILIIGIIYLVRYRLLRYLFIGPPYILISITFCIALSIIGFCNALLLQKIDNKISKKEILLISLGGLLSGIIYSILSFRFSILSLRSNRLTYSIILIIPLCLIIINVFTIIALKGIYPYFRKKDGWTIILSWFVPQLFVFIIETNSGYYMLLSFSLIIYNFVILKVMQDNNTRMQKEQSNEIEKESL